MRLFYELFHGNKLTATDLRKDLGLDAGYLSRILRSFEKKRLIKRERSASDSRQSFLALTPHGRKIFAELDMRQSEEVSRMLEPIPARAQRDLVDSMKDIERLLGAENAADQQVTLRTHRAGDMGWVMHRHGVLYSLEYGWDARFEALVGEIVVNFVRNYNPGRERCWIAEPMGSRSVPFSW